MGGVLLNQKLVCWTKQNGQPTKWHGMPIHQEPGYDVLTFCGHRTHGTDTATVFANKNSVPGGLDAVCKKCFDL